MTVGGVGACALDGTHIRNVAAIANLDVVHIVADVLNEAVVDAATAVTYCDVSIKRDSVDALGLEI